MDTFKCPFCFTELKISPAPKTCPNCSRTLQEIKSRIAEDAEAQRKAAIRLQRQLKSHESMGEWGDKKDFATLLPVKLIEKIDHLYESTNHKKRKWEIVAEALKQYFDRLDALPSK